jgi:RNA polymerase sigma-54 factor
MLKQNLQLKLSQKLSPQQIQLMKLIQLPTQAFEQRLKEEMVENPALETGKEDEYEKDEYDTTEDFDDYDDYDNERIDTDEINIDEYLSDDEIPGYKTQSNNYSDDDEDRSMPFAAPVSFHQNLIDQLNTFILSDDEREIAEFLVGSIDDMGYIRRSIPDIVDDMAFTQGIYTDEKTTDRILHIIHELEPAGVGARDLQECLLLQLKHRTPTSSVDLAINILEQQFDAFTKKHYDKLLQKFDISQDQLRAAIDEIERLNPKPGGSYESSNKTVEHVVPYALQTANSNLPLTEGMHLSCMSLKTIRRCYRPIKTAARRTTPRKTRYSS